MLRQLDVVELGGVVGDLEGADVDVGGEAADELGVGPACLAADVDEAPDGALVLDGQGEGAAAEGLQGARRLVELSLWESVYVYVHISHADALCVC